MEHLRKIQILLESIGRSVSDEKNQGVFGITTFGGIVYGWNIAGLHVGDFLTWALLFKGIAGIFTIFIAPPLGTFMNDIYKLRIRPRLFKNKRRP